MDVYNRRRPSLLENSPSCQNGLRRRRHPSPSFYNFLYMTFVYVAFYASFPLFMNCRYDGI